jgi:hypothetical protein
MENHVVRQLIQDMNRSPAGDLLKCAGLTPQAPSDSDATVTIAATVVNGGQRVRVVERDARSFPSRLIRSVGVAISARSLSGRGRVVLNVANI